MPKSNDFLRLSVSLRKHINLQDVELIDIFPFMNDAIWNILETFGCLIIEK